MKCPLYLLEKLAELEHEQWVEWSKELASKEVISKERLERWKSYWVSFDELPNIVQDADRRWARKVITIIEEG